MRIDFVGWLNIGMKSIKKVDHILGLLYLKKFTYSMQQIE